MYTNIKSLTIAHNERVTIKGTIQKFITLNIQASLLINSYMDLLTRREIWSVTEKFCASFEE